MSGKKILMIVGDYVEDYEAMVPYQMLEMVGHKVDTICPRKKAGDTVKTAVHDGEGDQTFAERVGHAFAINTDFDGVKGVDYDALLLPGGRAPEYIRLNKKVIELTKHFAETDKPIAAVCHGIQVLMAADVLKGKTCIGYPTLKPDALLAGAIWGEVEKDLANACVDGNLVTAPAWPAHPAWIRAFLKVLGTKIVLEETQAELV